MNDLSLDDLKQQVKTEISLGASFGQRSHEHYVTAGRLLIQAKTAHDHNTGNLSSDERAARWKIWLYEAGASPKTAARYMTLAKAPDPVVALETQRAARAAYAAAAKVKVRAEHSLDLTPETIAEVKALDIGGDDDDKLRVLLATYRHQK